jgi:hypothetical protein
LISQMMIEIWNSNKLISPMGTACQTLLDNYNSPSWRILHFVIVCWWNLMTILSARFFFFFLIGQTHTPPHYTTPKYTPPGIEPLPSNSKSFSLCHLSYNLLAKN